MIALLIVTTSPLAAAMQEIRAKKPCRKFEGHTGQVEDVIYLPHEQQMMTCSYDGSLRVWDLESGKQIGEDWRDGECRVLTIALSPDRKKVVSGSDDGAVRLWDIETGKVIAKWTENSESVRSVSWDRDGVRVVSGSDDGTARVWDVKSGEIALAIKTELTNVTVVIYSPDSTMIATGGRRPGFNQFINVWDSSTGHLIANLIERIGSVDCLVWSADGKTLFSGSFHGSARTWDTTTWQEITVLTENTHWISALALSPNGRFFASASSHSVQLWNLENGQPISFPLQHATGVGCMSFSTDGKLLATGCWDNAAYTWDVSAILKEVDLDDLLSNANNGDKSFLDNDATRQPLQGSHLLPEGFFDDSQGDPDPVGKRATVRPCHKFEGHTGQVEDIAYLLQGQQMMTCSYDGSLRVWNLETGKQVGEDWRDEEDGRYNERGVNAIALSPDGKKVVSGSDSAVRVWDIDRGKVIAKWTEITEPVRSVSWNRDGVRIVCGCNYGTAMVLDAESGEANLIIRTGLRGVEAVIYSPDSTMIATGGYGGIEIWDSNKGDLVANLKDHIMTMNCLAWAADGNTLFSGSFYGSVRTWNTTTWREITVLAEHRNRIRALALSPNGRIFASASSHSVQFWNLENGRPISLPLQHASDVGCMSFSTDGKLLATGCWDNTAYTWDVSAILREADLDDLLSDANGDDKAFLDNDATGQPLEPEAFFDNHHDHHIPPSSAQRRHATGLSSGARTLLGSFPSLVRRIPRGHPIDWARNLFSGKPHRSDSENITLREHRRKVVNVPFAQGHHKNATAREIRKKREKEKNAKKLSAASSRPPQSGVTQVVQTQQSSQSHPFIFSSTAHAVVTTSAITTSTTPPPDATIRQPGRWTRFWLLICCTSAEYTDGRN